MQSKKLNPYNGVENYILKHYPEVFTGIPDYPETRCKKEVVNEVMKDYLREILEIEHKEGFSDEELIYNATKIQKHWTEFKYFLNDHEYNY